MPVRVNAAFYHVLIDNNFNKQVNKQKKEEQEEQEEEEEEEEEGSLLYDNAHSVASCRAVSFGASREWRRRRQ